MTSRFSVYEALNHARKEVFVGVTLKPLEDLIETPRRGVPPEISHWASEETVTLRGLTEELPAEDAWEFACIYLSCYVPRAGWRVIAQGHPA